MNPASLLLDSFLDLDRGRYDAGQLGGHDAQQYPTMDEILAENSFVTETGPWDQRQGRIGDRGAPAPHFGRCDEGSEEDQYRPRPRDTTKSRPTTRSSTQTASNSSLSSHAPDRARKAASRKSWGSTAEPGPTTSSRRRGRRGGTKEASGNSADSKRDRFLESNRIAASKCRQKKKEWEKGLEETKFELESQNLQLHTERQDLMDQISLVKAQLMSHAVCNDPCIDQWIENEARNFVQATSAGRGGIGQECEIGK